MGRAGADRRRDGAGGDGPDGGGGRSRRCGDDDAPSSEPSEHEAVDVALLVVHVAVVVLVLPAVWLIGVLLGGP